MNTLQLINKLIVMVRSKEIILSNEKEAEHILQNVKEKVITCIRSEIWNDITDPRTGFYSPEYSSWKDMLEVQKKGDADYTAVLQEAFSEEELDIIWNYSHIEDALGNAEIKNELWICLDQLKMLSLFGEEKGFMEKGKQDKLEMSIRARIIGLFNLLYEG